MNKKGFTLIELLVVISIIAILAGMIVSGITYARQKAFMASTKGTINTVRIALSAYYADEGFYPGAADDPATGLADDITVASLALMGSSEGAGGRASPYVDMKAADMGFQEGAVSYFKLVYKPPTEAQMKTLYEDAAATASYYFMDAWGHPMHYIEIESRDKTTRDAGPAGGTLKGVTYTVKNREGFDIFSVGPQSDYTGTSWDATLFIGNY